MKFATPLKPLIMIGMTSLTLAAGTALAEQQGYPGYNPYLNNYRQAAPAKSAPYSGPMRTRQAQFDQRLDNQLQRILGGMEKGQLTMREATALLREHLEINAMERRYMADGRLGPREMDDLDRRLDQASKHIVFEKNDRDRAQNQDRGNDRDRRDRDDGRDNGQYRGR
jgi:hypothetical protein